MTEWLGVESAPKDGTCILGVDEYQEQRVIWWVAAEGMWVFAYTPSDYIDVAQTFTPVNWMNLPEPEEELE